MVILFSTTDWYGVPQAVQVITNYTTWKINDYHAR